MLITRRMLLSSVAALALNLPAVGQATSLSAPPIPFRGNPNVTIAAIDTSGGISCSRTSGRTPCFIQVSGSAMTATGTSTPFDDLSYSWDFGDPNGTEIFTNPTNGQPVNANIGQTGPEAAYCYRSAGTFTVTLTVVGKNGGGYTTATVTQSIVVSAFVAANTWYYDANAMGANNGTSPTDAFTSLASISSKVNNATGNTYIYLARGSHWISNAYIDIVKTTGLRIAPYGSGADPIMECNVDTSNPGRPLLGVRTTSRTSCSDIVVSNFGLKVSGRQFTGYAIVSVPCSNANQSLANIYFDNCSFTSNMSSSHSMNWVSVQFNTEKVGGNFNEFGIWGGSINSLPDDNAYGMAFFGGAYNWSFIMGLTNINGVGGATFNNRVHHMYNSVGNHALYRWINFGSSIVNGIATRNYCVKIDNYPPPQLNISAYSSGAGGVVRVTVSDTSQYTNGGNVYILDVTGTGAADVTSAGAPSGTGVWQCSIVDGTKIDLIGTTYNAAHVYTGGALRITGGTNYFLIDSNNITGTQRAFDSMNALGNPYASWLSNYVVQNNIVHDMPYDTQTSLPIAQSATYRDNNHWNNLYRTVNFSQGTPRQHNEVFRLYRNKFYISSSVGGGHKDHTIVNFGGTGVSWTNPQTFTDNIIQDMRTDAASVCLDSYSAQAALPSIIDRNQYYAPNATAGKFLYNGATSTTFATWQAAGFDVNGSVANPNWLDPANGKF